MLDLPRPWGTTKPNGVWYRRRRNDTDDLLTETMFKELITKVPLIVSISNYDKSGYNNFQYFAVFDFDNPLNPELSKLPLKLVSKKLKELK